MATPVTAEYFTSLGVPAAQAEAYATEHNRLANLPAVEQSAEVAQPFQRLPPPVLKPSTVTAPTEAQQARAEMDDISKRRASGDISDFAWRTQWEAKYLELAGVAGSINAYEQALPGEKNAMRHAWDVDNIQGTFEQSIDRESPARSPSDYQLPREENLSQEEAALDLTFRQALHAAGAPIELGNHIGQSVNETARQLSEAQGNLDAEAAIVERNERRLRQRWGSSYDANMTAITGLLRDAGNRSPAMKQLLADHPELFSSPDTASYLLRLAQSQSRRGAR